VDNNCDGLVDDDDPNAELTMWYQDTDGDEYGDADYVGYEACNPPPGFVMDNTDCDDSDATTNPGGSANESDPTLCMTDVDGDGYGEINPTNPNAEPGTDCDDNDANSIPADADGDGYSGCSGDCDDSNSAVNPGMSEIFLDGYDNDCDGLTDNLGSEDYVSSLEGEAENYLTFDNSLSISDLDGDGADDIIVGSNQISISAYEGGVFILNGSGYDSWNGLAEDYADAAIYGSDEYNFFGASVQGQGDVNGDGNMDIAFSGTDVYNDPYGYVATAVAVFLDAGSLSGTYYADEADMTFSGGESGYGEIRVSIENDLTGDGIHDVVIADWLNGYLSNQNGYFYNTYGGENAVMAYDVSGLSPGNYDMYDSYSTQAYTDDFDYLGQSMSGYDLDGDGSSNIAVSAPGNDELEQNAGCVYLVNGSTLLTLSEIEIEPATFAFGGGAAICSDDNDARFGWNAQPQFGDFNGDGVTDLALAGPGVNKAYVFFDAENLAGIINANSDADIVMESSGTPSWFGYSMAAGDFNGDGIHDIAIGAPDISHPIANDGFIFEFDTIAQAYSNGNAGVIYIYTGSTLLTTGTTLTENDANGSITSASTDDLFGTTLVASDMNGDGVHEIWVGAPQYNGDEGRATLYAAP
jgi:hypothetical protein